MFSIWHRKRKAKEVVGSAVSGGYLVWERKRLPDAGAEQYAFETYGTPIYDRALGDAATFIRRPLQITFPALYANYTAPILPNPPINTFQGQLATQPLMDPNTAEALNIVAPGVIPPDAYNALNPAYPTLAP